MGSERLGARFAVAGTACLVSLLLGEGVLRLAPSVNNPRIAWQQYTSQIIWLDEYTRMFKANIYQEFEEAYRPEGEKYFPRSEPRLFRTDVQGYILGPDAEPSHFTNFKILFSGGSVVECQEVDEPLRFPFVVQSILNDEGLSAIRSFNLGIRGHTTFETMKLMTGTSLFDGFQVIVFMHNINDWTVLANCGSYFTSSPQGATDRHGSARTQIAKMIESTRNCLTTHYDIAFLVHNLHRRYFSSEIFPQSEEPDMVSDEMVGEIRRFYRENIIGLAALAHAKKATPVFVTQPSPLDGKLQTALNNELKDVCAVDHYALIDVAGKFPAESCNLFFPDGVHLNNEGSLLVGQIIAEELPHILESQLDELPVEKEWLKSFQDTGTAHECVIEDNSRYPVMCNSSDRLYFQSCFNGKNQICYVDLKSGIFKRVSPLPLSFWHPCPSDKGVYATSDCLDNEKIFNLTGQEITLLPIFSDEGFEGAIPALAPDGRICFPGSREKQPPDLFLYSPESETLEQITASDWEEWRPVFHPDGKRLFYISNEKGKFDIFCYDFEIKTSEFVVGTEGDDWDVDVSPDGNVLVFASQEEGNFDLMIYSLVSKELRHLTDGPGNEWDPRFSPDGRLVMYAEERDGKSSVHFLEAPSL